MGNEVLAVNTSASPYLRSYAHCSKGRVRALLYLLVLFYHFMYKAITLGSITVLVLFSLSRSKTNLLAR